MFPFDWLAPYLQPGTRQYHNTPVFIREKLQNVTHVMVVTTFLLAGYDHSVMALSHILVEWARTNYPHGVQLLGFACETLSSDSAPYCTAILLVRADLAQPTGSTSSLHHSWMHLGTDTNRAPPVLDIRNWSTSMRTVAYVFL